LPIALSSTLLAFLYLPTASYGQYPPPITQDSNITIIHSPVDSNVTIRFKSPPIGTCTTAFSTQQQYAGYVTLPPYTLAPIQQNYTINTFFWFIEARLDALNAPLTIYMNGGPGSSSMVGMFQECGPCEVVEIAQGQFGTQARDWGWDRSSNILFVDQPNEVGFSYDTPTNGSLNLFTSEITQPPSIPPPNQPAFTFLNGTFSSNNSNTTTNTTAIAARAIWHMLQGFLGTFPEYNPGNRPNSTQSGGVVGVNLFAESYGGKYGPAFASFWEKQNALRRNNSVARNKTLEIRLASLGIMQGCVDDLVQGRYYPIFANNNTYNIQAISLVDEQTAANSYINANGCQQLIQSCRAAVKSMDPQSNGDIATVNQVCQNAQQNCNQHVIGPYQGSGRNVYDITQKTPDPFPPSTYLEYLNTAEVQAAIGAVVNYTESNPSVSNAFQQTGDYQRGDQINQMAYLLSLGVRVALIYGDRDYICNWLGGQAVSYAIAAQSPAHSSFYNAGYSAIVTNSSYVGGVVREYGNLSFSRIYDAGHLIPAYQPETAFTVFTRIIMGTDISTGKPVNLANFATGGDANATYTNTVPAASEPKCFIRNIDGSCTEQQKSMLQQGHGVIINGALYSQSNDWKPPPSSISVGAGYPGTVPSSMTATATSSPPGSAGATTSTSVTLTGVFVATGTPSTTKKSAALVVHKIDMGLSMFVCVFMVARLGIT